MCGATLVVAYLALVPFGDYLEQANLSSFVLANVIMLVARRFAQVREAEGFSTDPFFVTSVMKLGVFLTIAFCALFLFFNDPLVCQRYFTVLCAVHACPIFYATLFDREFLGAFPWVFRDVKHGRLTAARWAIVGDITLIAINETVIATAGEPEWIEMRALAPIAMFSIVWWAFMATRPYEGEDES